MKNGKPVKQWVYIFGVKSVFLEDPTIEELHSIVIEKHPNAFREGSVSSWGWFLGDMSDEHFVAEAIAASTGRGWFLRVR